MATVTRYQAVPRGLVRVAALLTSGDRMSQAEFHRRYEQYPEHIKFELIKGTVYTASPEGMPHSKHAVMLTTVLGNYQADTPGVEAGSDPTVILGGESEPQPDVLLRILPDCGGRSRNEGLYLAGPPELVIEIAYSSAAIDLHDKKDDYERNGVIEYVVVCIEEQHVHWFDLAKHKSNKLRRDAILRSKVFPGLWVDTKALFRGEIKRLLQVLNEGLCSPEHSRFVRRLAKAAAARKRRANK
ncbi:MAG TPA: Uma2 family endonuclease [Pirellulales bacterium]|nr:Uma2 family endonuclease [Pirellulales bacterium]